MRHHFTPLSLYTPSEVDLHITRHHQIFKSGRLVKKGYDGDMLCVYCKYMLESCDHLLFEGSFACKIWSKLLHLCGVNQVTFT